MCSIFVVENRVKIWNWPDAHICFGWNSTWRYPFQKATVSAVSMLVDSLPRRSSIVTWYNPRSLGSKRMWPTHPWSHRSIRFPRIVSIRKDCFWVSRNNRAPGDKQKIGKSTPTNIAWIAIKETFILAYRFLLERVQLFRKVGDYFQVHGVLRIVRSKANRWGLPMR